MIRNFVVEGEPKGKGRPRFSRRGCPPRTPDDTVAYENLVRLSYRQTNPYEEMYPAGTPVCVNISVFYKIPKNTSKKRLNDMLVDKYLPTKKPDCDNIAKIICDALNGIAYHDDAQVVRLSISKHYSAHPRVYVSIGSLAEIRELEGTKC